MKKFLTAMMLLAIIMLGAVAMSGMKSAEAISNAQQEAIQHNCDEIKNTLKDVQIADAKIRVYLGRIYDAILEDYIVPLNVRLVENNLSSAELVENQNKIAETKTLFANDYVNYQQSLEELTLTNCKNEAETFYDRLEKVRQKRKVVEQDTLRMRTLISNHVKLANQLKAKL